MAEERIALLTQRCDDLAQRCDDQQTQLDEQRAQLDEQRTQLAAALISAEQRLRSALQDGFEEFARKALPGPSMPALPAPSSAPAAGDQPTASSAASSASPQGQPTEAERWESKMSTPFMQFGGKEMYTDGISMHLKLTRSLRKEFEDNLGGKYVELLDYVFKGPAKDSSLPDAPPSAKGPAPTPADVPAYTRDLGRDGWTLDDFRTKPGQTPGELTKLDIGMLRLYTGPVFKPWNFWLRYGPPGPSKTKYLLCCSETPYHKEDADFGAFHPGKLFVADPENSDVCKTCRAAKSAHSQQLMDEDWSTSIALLYSAIVKLANQTTESGVVYRGIDESKVQFPPEFVGQTGMADGNELLGGVEPGFMSTTQDRHVASVFAKNEGSVFQIQLKTTSRGAKLSQFSMYQAEEEMLFPPYTMLSCHGASIQSGPSGEKQRILRVDATFNPDTRLMDMVAGIKTEDDEPARGFFNQLYQATQRDEEQLRTEKHLDLSRCKMNHKHLPALCHLIKQNQLLQVLDLRDNEADLEGDKGLKDDTQLAAFADALRGHPSLHVVYIGAAPGLAFELSWMRGMEGFHEGCSCEVCQDASPIVGTRYTHTQATSNDPSTLNTSGSVRHLCRWHHHKESTEPHSYQGLNRMEIIDSVARPSPKYQIIEPATFRSLRAEDRPEAQQGCATIALKLAKVRDFPDESPARAMNLSTSLTTPRTRADLGAQASFNAASTTREQHHPDPT